MSEHPQELTFTQEHKLRQDTQQRKAFSRWVLTQLIDKSSTLPDEFKDANALEADIARKFQSGVLLAELAQVLTQTKIKVSLKQNDLFHQQNLGSALDSFSYDGCTLLNIHATSISAGNERMILGLLWQLIQHYQLSSSFNEPEPELEPEPQTTVLASPSKPAPKKKKAGAMTMNMNEAKKHMIDFVNQQISTLSPEQQEEVKKYTCHNGELKCTNLDKDWQTSGMLFALIVALHPHESSQNETTKLLKQESNNTPCQQGIILHACLETAHKGMHIPLLLDSEDMIHSIDSNAILTYLSYYLNFVHTQKSQKPTAVSPRAAASPVVPSHEPITSPLPLNEPVTLPPLDEPITLLDAPITPIASPPLDEPIISPSQPTPHSSSHVVPTLTPQAEPEPETIPGDERELLARELKIMEQIVAKKEEKPNYNNIIVDLEELVKSMNKFANDVMGRKSTGYNLQLAQRMKEHIQRVESVITFLKFTQSVLDKPTPEPTPVNAPIPAPLPTQQQTSAPILEQPKPQQDDLTMYLIIALVVALLALLLK